MITITLDKKTLRAAGMCDEGAKLFRELAKLQRRYTLTVEWGPWVDLWLAKEHPAWSHWLRQRRLVPRASLDGERLTDLDLSYACFVDGSFWSTDFSRSSLEGVDMYRTNALYARFNSADLTNATIADSNLYDADFRGACLRGADLRGSNLRQARFDAGSDLYGADLRGADLAGAEITTAGNLVVADLRGARRGANDPPIPGWKNVGGLLALEGA